MEMPSEVATSQMWLVTFILTRLSSLVSPATFEGLSSHMQLEATMLEGAYTE